MDGTLIRGNPDVEIGAFSIDTRTIKPGEWFIAFKGKNSDGHDYIQTAIEQGAGGVVVTETDKLPIFPKDFPVIRVTDAQKALYDYARYIRVSTPLFPWIGITGSVGKTTTKGFLAEILKSDGFTPLVTPGNYNTEIGVPLSISMINSCDYDAFVLEFAMRARGEIAYLAEMTRPQIGVITNIAPVHLETLGSLDEIAEAKGELLDHLDEKGVAILNQDDPYFNFLKEKCSDKFRIFSVSGSSGDIRATNVRWNEEKQIVFDMHIRGEKFTDVKLKTPSMGMMESALAASAAALAVPIPVRSILDGVQRYDGEELRMSIFVKDSGVKVILDCYNANPKSMVDSIKVLSLYKQKNDDSDGKSQKGRTIAVLGGMLELGDESQKWHEKVARYTLDCGIDFVVSVGEEGMFYHNILSKDSRVQSFHFMTNAEVIVWLKKNTNPNDVVLIKGSRGFKLEEVGKADW